MRDSKAPMSLGKRSTHGASRASPVGSGRTRLKEDRQMVNLRRLTDQAKKVVEKRGGTDSLKDDADELQDIAKSKGSLKDKAKAAGRALKDPGKPGKQDEPQQ